jgi:hypothetical protein
VLNPKTTSCYVCMALSLVLFVLLPGEAESGAAQTLRTVYDGRAEARASTPSNTDVQLVRRYALPKARRLWRGNDACTEGFEVIGVATGSFTKANTEQRAVLYRFCVTGHNFANNGIAIIEGGSVVAHIVYEGGEDYSIGALPDINGNGLSEIILGDGSTNQGYTTMVAILIEASPAGVKKWGIADVYEDNCGTMDRCEMTAYKISVKPGPTPVFYREAYKKRNERWTRAGGVARYALRELGGSYKLLD